MTTPPIKNVIRFAPCQYVLVADGEISAKVYLGQQQFRLGHITVMFGNQAQPMSLEITQVRQTRIGSLSVEDLRAVGYVNTHSLKQSLRLEHPDTQNITDSTIITLVDFDVHGAEEEAA